MMAVFTEQQKKLTRKLITALTGFAVAEENFKLCFQFCKSNFQFHRFLSVNDFQVKRKVDGLTEKFKVHSQLEKAECFRQLTESFISSNLEHSFPRSDAHYGVLSFLLLLSHSPLHANFEPAMPTTLPAEEEEEFDWTSYLMEGIEYSPQHSSGSERNDIGLLLGIAAAHVLLKQIPCAHNQLKIATKVQWMPENGEDFEQVLLLLADIYIQSGKYDVALDLFKKCIAYNHSGGSRGSSLGSHEPLFLPELTIHLHAPVTLRNFCCSTSARRVDFGVLYFTEDGYPRQSQSLHKDLT